MGRGMCIPAKIIARLGPGTLLAELRGPGTAFPPELRSGAFRPTLTPGAGQLALTVLEKNHGRVTASRHTEKTCSGYTTLKSGLAANTFN